MEGGDCLNRKEGILVGIVILSTFIGGVFASNPASQLLNVFVTNFPQNQNVTVTNPPGSHLGQDITDHVTLYCNLPGPLPCGRVLANGTFVFPFSVPAGSALVVTDVNWIGSSSDTPGTTEILNIGIGPSPSTTATVYLSISTVSAGGTIGGSDHMTAGFVVSSAATMVGSFSPPDAGGVVTLSGYLKILQ